MTNDETPSNPPSTDAPSADNTATENTATEKYAAGRKGTLLKAAAAFVALVVVTGLGAAAAFGDLPGISGSDSVAKAPPTPVITNTANVVIDTSRPTGTIDSTAFGLSLETTDIVRPGFANGNFPALLRSLGTGVLRVGANSVDTSFWTSDNQRAPQWADATVKPANIDALAKVAEASDWKVILSVNLKHFDPARAANEAKYAHDRLGDHLKAIAIGNEPNVYYPDSAKFNADWKTYSAAIRQAAPLVHIAGADVGNDSTDQAGTTAFLADQKAKPTISALTEHHYSQTVCGGKTSSIPALLSLDTWSADRAAAKQTADRASALHVPGILDEVNSVSCEGEAGVSDVFASSLWSLGEGLASTQEGARGVYFHSGMGRCGGAKPAYKDYSPVCAPSAKAERSGTMRAQPEYYGLMALSQFAGGQFMGVKNPDVAHLRIFAVRNGNKLSIVVINTRPPSGPDGDAATMVSFTGVANYKTGRTMALRTTSNDGLSSKRGVVFAGRTARSDGSFPALVSKAVTPDTNTWKVAVPNGSAVILTLN